MGVLDGCRLDVFSSVEFRNYRTLSYRPDAAGSTSSRAATRRVRPTSSRRWAVLLTGRSFRTTRLAELPALGIGGGRRCSGDLRRGQKASDPCAGPSSARRDGNWQATGETLPLGAGHRLRLAGPGDPATALRRRGGFHRRVRGAAVRRVICRPWCAIASLSARRNRLLQSRASTSRPPGSLERAAGRGGHGADRPPPAGRGRAADGARARLSGPGGSGAKVEVRYRSVARARRPSRRRSWRRSSGRGAWRCGGARRWSAPIATIWRSSWTASTRAPSARAGSSGCWRWPCAWPRCCR